MLKPLLILPFDHRSSFSKGLLGYSGKLNQKQVKKVKELKQIVFAGFQKTLKSYQNKDFFGILVDEQFGAEILRAAKKINVNVCLTTEKSGQKEFKFEYGQAFGQHIKKFAPDYVKVLVRYNSLNKEVNTKQLKRLKKLSDYCENNNYKLLFELLVPATDADLKKAGGQSSYDQKLRVTRTVQAIKEIKQQVKVDVWKLEGFSVAGWKKVISAVGKNTPIIFLGRGQSEKKVKQWLISASKFESVIGFAIGRTIFAQPLKDYLGKKITKIQAIDKIARKYNLFVRLWTREKRLKLED